ncbi:Phasin domain-containing protein OS=Afipia felis OX=1035 GN=BN961_03062 PE=4 SV=1 [Afipia felis]
MNSELPIHLYKANVELQLQITRLWQESSHHWLETMQQLSTGGMLETTSRIQGLQQAADWQAFATLPSEVFWRLCQGRVGDAQTVGQAAAKSQVVFADGLRQALATWQASVSEALGASGDTASFVQLWTQPWKAPGVAPQGNAKE